MRAKARRRDGARGLHGGQGAQGARPRVRTHHALGLRAVWWRGQHRAQTGHPAGVSAAGRAFAARSSRWSWLPWIRLPSCAVPALKRPCGHARSVRACRGEGQRGPAHCDVRAAAIVTQGAAAAKGASPIGGCARTRGGKQCRRDSAEREAPGGHRGQTATTPGVRLTPPRVCSRTREVAASAAALREDAQLHEVPCRGDTAVELECGRTAHIPLDSSPL